MTVDKEYNQSYNQNNTSSVNKQYPFLQNNRLLLQTMTDQAAELRQWLRNNSQHKARSRFIYTTENSAITQENESRDFKKKRKKKTGKIKIMQRLTLMRAIIVIIP